MNNTLGLGVFAALVYFRNLDWQFSAGEFTQCIIIIVPSIQAYLLSSEVTVILLVEFAVGFVAIISGFVYKHTYLVSVYSPHKCSHYNNTFCSFSNALSLSLS